MPPRPFAETACTVRYRLHSRRFLPPSFVKNIGVREISGYTLACLTKDELARERHMGEVRILRSELVLLLLNAGVWRFEHPGDSHASDVGHWLRMTILLGAVSLPSEFQPRMTNESRHVIVPGDSPERFAMRACVWGGYVVKYGCHINTNRKDVFHL